MLCIMYYIVLLYCFERKWFVILYIIYYGYNFFVAGYFYLLYYIIYLYALLYRIYLYYY